MANVDAKVASIRAAVYGKDVRESIASGIELIDGEVEDTTARQVVVDGQEVIRLANEISRKSVESTRVTAEGVRTTAEGVRTTAEAARATDYASLQGIIINANNAADLQNQINGHTTSLAKNVQQLGNINNNPTNYSGAVITFCDDDNFAEFKTVWNPIMASKNIDISIAVVTSTVGIAGRLTLQELKDLQTSGCDVLCHTATHINSDDITEANAITDYTNAIDYMKANGLNGYDTLVYPGGLHDKSNVRVKNIARKYFKNAIGTELLPNSTTPHYNSLPIDNWLITRLYGDTSTPQHTLADLKGFLDEAILNNGWIIMMTHSQLMGASEITKITGLIDYAQTLSVPILKFSEAIKIKGNDIAMGEYSSPSSIFVSKNGANNISSNLIMKSTSNETMDNPITDYKLDTETIKTLSSVGDTYLHIGGIMRVVRSSNSDIFSYATFTSYTKNKMYMRKWIIGTTSWGIWEVVNDSALVIQPSNDGSIILQPLSYFALNKETSYPCGISANCPDGTGGYYKVYRVEDIFSYSTFKVYNSEVTYSRNWVSGAWGAWTKNTKKLSSQADSVATDVATMKTDFNALLARLRTSGLM